MMLIRTTCDCGSFENSWPGPTAAKHGLNFMMEAYILNYNLWIVNTNLDSFHLVSIHDISKETIQVRSPPLKQSWSPGKSERRRLSSDRSTHLRLTQLKLLGDVIVINAASLLRLSSCILKIFVQKRSQYFTTFSKIQLTCLAQGHKFTQFTSTTSPAVFAPTRRTCQRLSQVGLHLRKQFQRCPKAVALDFTLVRATTRKYVVHCCPFMGGRRTFVCRGLLCQNVQ